MTPPELDIPLGLSARFHGIRMLGICTRFRRLIKQFSLKIVGLCLLLDYIFELYVQLNLDNWHTMVAEKSCQLSNRANYRKLPCLILRSLFNPLINLNSGSTFSPIP